MIQMDISQIKTFLNLVELKSYSKTAMKMYITQPAVSLRIKSLEEELGQKLIIYKDKKIQTTYAGQYFYKNMLDTVSNIDDTINTIQQELSIDSEYTIGVTPFCAKYILPTILSELYKHPHYKLMNIRTVPQSLQLIDLYTKGVVDAFILSANNLPQGSEYKLLWEEPIVLVCPPNHPLSQYNNVNIDNIKIWPLILLSTDRDNKYFYNYDLMKMCEDQNIKLDIKYIMDNVDLVKELIKTDQFISFLPYESVKAELENGDLQKISTQLPVKLSFELYFYSQNRNDMFLHDLYGILKKAKFKKDPS